MASGIDSVRTAALLTQLNGGAADTITSPLRCLWLSAVRSVDTGSDTEAPNGSGYVQGVGSLFSGAALTFAAATAAAPSTSNSNVAASVTNMPATTWAGNKIVDSAQSTRTVTDGVTNSTTTITSATAAFVVGDVGAIVTGSADLPTNVVIASVTNGTTAVLSQACTGSHAAQTFNILKPTGVKTTFWATLGSSKTVNLGDTVTVPSGSWQTTLA